MKIFKFTLLAGWLLWFVCALLILEFPNAEWNRAVAEVVLWLALGLIVSTLGAAGVFFTRLIAKLVKPELFKWFLVGGWVLLFFGAVLAIWFPHAAWNQGLAFFLWVLSIILFCATLGFCVMTAIRMVVRQTKRPALANWQPTTTAAQPRSHWSRRLVVGVAALAGMAVFIAALVGGLERQFKSSPVYQASVAQARASSKVIEVLGQPIATGWFVSGQLMESNDGTGHAILTIPISGPKGTGRLRVQAGRRAGNWRLSSLLFVSAGDATTDLLAERAE